MKTKTNLRAGDRPGNVKTTQLPDPGPWGLPATLNGGPVNTPAPGL